MKNLRLECGLDTSGGGGEGGVGKQEEWSHLHCALHLIESCGTFLRDTPSLYRVLMFLGCLGDMLLRSAQLNAQLCSTVVSCTPNLRSAASPSNPFGSFPYLSTYYPDEHTDVMELLVSVEEGTRPVMGGVGKGRSESLDEG